MRAYRAPRREDDNGAEIRARLEEKLPEWEAFDMVPGESIPDGNKTTEPQRYGMRHWRDLFSPRQLLCHGTGVEVFREMLEADRSAGELSEIRKAAYGYLAITLDTLLNYNNRAGRWDSTTGRGPVDLRPARLRIRVVVCRNGSADHRSWIRLGDREDLQVHRGTRRADLSRNRCRCLRPDAA